MSRKACHLRGVLLVVAAGLVLLFPCWVRAQKQANMQVQAQRAAKEPLKIDIKPLGQGQKAGDQVPVEIMLLDANNQPVKAVKDTWAEVEIINPSGKSQKRTLELKAGESSKKLDLPTDEAGVANLKVRHKDNELLDGSSSVLIRRKSSAPKPAAAPPPSVNKAKPARPKPSAMLRGPAFEPAVYRVAADFRPARVHLAAAVAYAPQTGGGSHSASSGRNSAKLMLQVADRGIGGVLANGKDPAKVFAHYLSEDGTAAPSDIQVWLRWSNGQLDPHPLIIKKGGFTAEATWISRWPLDATVSFVTSSPKYQLEGPAELPVKFIPPIYGIALVGPEQVSLVDNGTLVARFFDEDGNPIQTATKRRITFVSKTPNLRLNPAVRDVEPGSSEASTVLLPSGSGKTEIEASTPGYKPVNHQVAVTVGTVIALCIIGGVLGGLCSFYQLRGSFFWRIFTGIVAAALFTWAYVYGALPSIESSLAHSLLNVLFVSIVGGYLGIQGVELIAKRFKPA